MKKIIALLLVTCSLSTFSQTYGIAGNIIGEYEGGDFYTIEIPDDFTIHDIAVGFKAHVLENGEEYDTTGVMDYIGVHLMRAGFDDIAMTDANCTYTEITTMDWTFSVSAPEYINEACEPTGSFKPTNTNRFGESITTDLTVFNGENAAGIWQIMVNWKPYAEDDIDLFLNFDNELSVDSLYLIFNSNQTASLPSNSTLQKPTIYPNPVQQGELLTVGLNTSDIYTLKLYDISGNLIYTTFNATGNSSISTATLESGCYIVEMERNGEMIHEKVVIN